MARKAPGPDERPIQRLDGDPFLQAMAGRIRELRVARKLTQEEFAHRAGISVSFVSMIERGERSPSYGTLHQLADGLDLDVADLFREGVSETPGRQAEPVLELIRTAGLTRPQVARLVRVGRALFGLDSTETRASAAPGRGKLCTFPSCGRPLLARGQCASHYHAQRRRSRRV